ncbi:hypothetical protein BKA82DRAFT_2384338 [Pisolithus tinctorius]|nr:hypothetical protein BKA82DRAFT_2384338 [Pisolithus tinctorius]
MPAGRWAVLGFLVHPLLILLLYFCSHSRQVVPASRSYPFESTYHLSLTQLGSACLLYHTWGVPRGDFTSAVFQKLSRMQASPATSGTILIPSALSLHHVQGPQFPVILSVYFPGRTVEEFAVRSPTLGVMLRPCILRAGACPRLLTP